MAINTAYDLAGKTLCLSSAGLAIGGTASKVKLAAPNGAGTDFAINGLLYHKADADDVFTLSGTALAASEACVFLMCLNSSGTASIVQGEIVDTQDVENGVAVVSFPAVPADKCAVGAVLVETSSTGAFTPGTTELSAAGVTDTYLNFIVPPSKGLGAAYVTG